MPLKGYKQTKEHRIANSGRIPWNKGEKCTDETRKKISQSLEKLKVIGKHPWLGKKHSEETKRKMSINMIGKKNHRYGKKFSEETKRKMRNSANSGEKHHKWKGGYENKLYLNNKRRIMKLNAEGEHTLEEWIFLKKLFKNKCVSCKEKKALTIDHIIPLSRDGSDYISNIQPLCKNCNSKKHNKIISYV